MPKFLKFTPAEIRRGFFARFERFNGEGYPVHGHANFCEIQLVLRGTGLHWIDGKSRRASAGDLWLVTGKTIHGWTSTRQLALYNLMFSPASLRRANPSIWQWPGFHERFGIGVDSPLLHFKLGPADLETAATLFRKMRRESGDPEPLDPVLVRESFFWLVRFLCQLPVVPQVTSSGVEKAMQVLETKSPSQVSGKDLAKISKLSPAQFHRRFMVRFGVSPHQHLLRRRLELACRLLDDRRLPVLEVARECEFSDPNYFSRKFRSFFGTSPSRWRDKALGGTVNESKNRNT